MLTLPCTNYGRPYSWPIRLVINLLWEHAVWSGAWYQVSPGVNMWNNSEGLQNMGTGWTQRPRAINSSLVVSHWPLEKGSLESWEKTALSMTEKKVTPSIVVRYLVQGWWPRAKDSLQILISKSQLSNLGGIIVMGIAVAELLWGGWICKHSLLPLPAPGTPAPAPCLGELPPALPKARSHPPCLPLRQPQLFRGLSCWPFTHLHGQYD